MKPQGLLTFLLIRPLSDLFLWLWRLERRVEFLYRPQFDRWARPPLFAFLQSLQNRLRDDEHLALAEERPLPDEESAHPGDHRRAGRVHPGELAARLRAAIRQHQDVRGCPRRVHRAPRPAGRPSPWLVRRGRRPTRRGSASPDRGRTRRPTWRTTASARSRIKVMGVEGPKLADDETGTQDLILVSPASFVTPDIRENARLQRWVRAKAPLGYLDRPAGAAPAAPRHAAALLADAQQPAGGAVLQQRAVPAR